MNQVDEPIAGNNMSADSRRTRPPVVAGRFYEADPSRCRADATACCAETIDAELPDTLCGGVAPHAGWVCSGRVAGLTWRALAERTEARTVFLTGSVHTVELDHPALDTNDAWSTPLGEVEVDAELRDAIAGLDGFGVREDAHTFEHALEVELPILLHAFGEGLRFVPCMIPPHGDAPRWGEVLGELLRAWREPVLVVASSDLTHYGPNYGFTPAGGGEAGGVWAHGENDRGFIDRVERLDASGALAHADENRSACGGGAVAAVIAASKAMGAERGYTLLHTDSSKELARAGHRDRDNSVGYASIVFG